MLRTLKSKRKRTSKVPTSPLDIKATQNDLFDTTQSSVEDKENDITFNDDSIIDKLNWDELEEQIAHSADPQHIISPQTMEISPRFSENDRKQKYRSPLLKTPSKSQLSRNKGNALSPKINSPCFTSPRSSFPAALNCHEKQLDNEIKESYSFTTPPIPNSKKASSVRRNIDTSFSTNILQTPLRRGSTQRQLYNTGLISPYSTKTDETIRLGVPEEVFRLLSKIRGITTLYPWQEETVSKCLSGGNHILTCPTSGGKTLVGEMLLLNAVLTRDADALLILPYVALVEEKVKELAEFAEHFSFGLERYAGSRGRLPPRRRRKKKTIYVATIEKANSLFNSLYEEGRCSELGVVVVDEVHMIGDGYRGAILETCLAKFLSLRPVPRIVGMTATLNNHGEVSSFLECSMEHIGGMRPVPISEYVKVNHTVFAVDKITETGLVTHRELHPLEKPGNTSTLRDTDGVAALVQEKFDRECILVFCPTKSSCETTARMLTVLLTSSASDEVKEKRGVLVRRLKSETGNLDPTLAETLPMGISYHHSGLTGDERTLVEEAFSDRIVTVLCCTTTLAAGVNLPASRVIIRSLKTGSSNLTRTRYLQMVGRAGRTGLSSTGDSFLLGRDTDKRMISSLVFGELENVMSCLDETSLTLTLLHLIGSGMIVSLGDVGVFMKRTLLHTQQPDLCLSLAETALKSLQDSKFVEKKDGKILPTTFGKAVYKSSLDPAISHDVIRTLRQANKHIVLQGDLHLVYLCVPPADILQNIYIDWLTYFNGYNQFEETASLTFTAVGLTEAYLARRAFAQNSSDTTTEIPYKRFYLAGAIHKIISGVPLWEVSQLFKIPRGSLQSAMSSCTSHASKLANFSKELPEYWALSAIFEALVQKLFFAGAPELAQILELPGIRLARAKQLYRSGYQTLQKLAAAEPRLLVGDINHLTKKQAQKIISSAKIMLREQADALTDAALQLLEEV